jgi:molecular chaperone GrpE
LHCGQRFAAKLEMGAGRPQFDKMQEKTVQPQEAENTAKPLEAQLAEAQARIEQQRDAMLRAMADAENARKRFQAEAASAQKYAVERFAESLLPVADSLEAALDNTQASPEALRDGVQLTLKQLSAAFQKAHVASIAPVPGERFDPHRHQAMAAVEADCARHGSKTS